MKLINLNTEMIHLFRKVIEIIKDMALGKNDFSNLSINQNQILYDLFILMITIYFV